MYRGLELSIVAWSTRSKQYVIVRQSKIEPNSRIGDHVSDTLLDVRTLKNSVPAISFDLSELVSCLINSFKNTIDRFNNLISRLRPTKRLGVLVVNLKVVSNGFL